MDFLVKMGAAIGAFTAALLFITCYFWKKNKRLEYKYSKLVMSSNKECELPVVEQLCCDGGREGEVEDEVVYSKKKHPCYANSKPSHLGETVKLNS
ncbi:endosome/lysosome-associated apoptosis and autophagy regulator family member 2-like [Salvelinus sp. IW2-2015]|uniref:endosome/lysosome-associated apoptosis and autophagy regulator family member 2-like n=1 Tax=Salvelinus sp. IW2-2015 TaxID=2691554 RepID=UPI0038D4F93B